MSKPGIWLCVRISGSAEALEIAANRAFELGASGLEETAEGVGVYFPLKTPRNEIRGPFDGFVRSLRSTGNSIGDPVYETIQEEGWGWTWRENFKPVRVGSRIVVKPPWEPWKAGPSEVVIDISPKMAFGTGSHETTRLCLEMLECCIKPEMEVLDVGTGSGILSVAAVKLGASRSDALDIEEESVENAEENARLNGVADRLTVHLGSLEILKPKPYDLILANIDRKTLVPMLPKFPAYGRSGTILLLSGILIEEKQEILDALRQSPFKPIESRELGEWAGFAAEFIRQIP